MQWAQTSLNAGRVALYFLTFIHSSETEMSTPQPKKILRDIFILKSAEKTYIHSRSNISNTRDSVSSGYPNTEKRVENTTRSGVFLTKFEVFG